MRQLQPCCAPLAFKSTYCHNINITLKIDLECLFYFKEIYFLIINITFVKCRYNKFYYTKLTSFY
ncbi:MAG: hypothetical protein CMM47_05465 [Rhodospirillaceae bacterium]|nr:hypothetical protein [Rhodospirillaceae bacterium]